MIYAMNHKGVIRKTTAANTNPLEHEQSNLFIGPATTSDTFLEVPLYVDDTPRVNSTDQEIKEFFEMLIRGTSLSLTTDQMTIET
jgi:hypothetical protein